MPEGEDVIEVKNGKAKRESVKVPSSTVFLFFYSVLQYSRVGTAIPTRWYWQVYGRHFLFPAGSAMYARCHYCIVSRHDMCNKQGVCLHIWKLNRIFVGIIT